MTASLGRPSVPAGGVWLVPDLTGVSGMAGHFCAWANRRVGLLGSSVPGRNATFVGPLSILSGAGPVCDVNRRLGIPQSVTRWVFRASIFAVLLLPGSVLAGELASSCPPIPASAFPPLGTPPVIGVWHEKELSGANWSPPSCTGWASAARSRLLVTLAGQFKFNGPLATLADRIGAVSSLREVRYWSADKKAWRPLVNDASALASPSPLSRRDDFKAADRNKGARLYYRETDEDDRDTVYRMDVIANSPDSVVLANENITPIKRFVFTIFKPSTLQSVVILQRLSANSFGVYM